MKKNLSIVLLIGLLILSGCQQVTKRKENMYNIIPQPNEMSPQSGRFHLDDNVTVTTSGCTKQVEAIVDEFRAQIRQVADINIQQQTTGTTSKGANIHFVTQSGLPAEGYHLSINPNSITLTASTPNGFSMVCKLFISFYHLKFMGIKLLKVWIGLFLR